MRIPGSRFPATFGAIAVVACSLVAWLWAAPGLFQSSSAAFITVFLIGGATVSLLTWRNAQATSTIAQVLHETESATPREPRVR